jgi:hypothetical protein
VWDWLIAAAFLVFLVLRNLRVPEAPLLKWAILPAFGMLVAGTVVVNAGNDAVGLTLIVAGGISIVLWGLWDRLWREENGYSTFW